MGHGRAIAAGPPRGESPGLASIAGIRGDRGGALGILIVTADNDNLVSICASDRKNSRGSITVGDRCLGDGPGESRVSGVEDAGGRAASSEKNIVAGKQEASIACGECAFGRKGRGHLVSRQRIPVLAVDCKQKEKFPVDRIAQCKTTQCSKAGDRVQKEFLALVGVLESPGLTAVGCLVNAGFFTFAT